MDLSDLDALEQLGHAASPGPWHVLRANDTVCMSAVLVMKNPAVGRCYDQGDGGWEAEDAVAACLLQHPEAVAPDDRRADGNARLIAALRNQLPALLELARRALATNAGSGQKP